MIPQGISGGQSVVLDTTLARVYRLKKGVMTTARLVNDRLRASAVQWTPIMVTLTYERDDQWRPDHISKFMDAVQKWSGRKSLGGRYGTKLPYVWVAELQKRGAVHYHVLLWIPKRWRIPYPDKQGWWKFGASGVDRVKNPVGYVAKYASKFESKGQAEFPKGLRLHGIGGLEKREKRIIAWWKLPKDMRAGEEGSCGFRRAKGGGWQNVDTDEITPSQWGLAAVGQGEFSSVRLVRKPITECQRDKFQCTATAIHREWLGRIARQSEDRREDWNYQLQTNRVQWIADIERAGMVTPAVGASPLKQSLRGQITAVQHVPLLP